MDGMLWSTSIQRDALAQGLCRVLTPSQSQTAQGSPSYTWPGDRGRFCGTVSVLVRTREAARDEESLINRYQ
jgi:hypothetical protein